MHNNSTFYTCFTFVAQKSHGQYLKKIYFKISAFMLESCSSSLNSHICTAPKGHQREALQHSTSNQNKGAAVPLEVLS